MTYIVWEDIYNRVLKKTFKIICNTLGIICNNHYFCRPNFKAENNG